MPEAVRRDGGERRASRPFQPAASSRAAAARRKGLGRDERERPGRDLWNWGAGVGSEKPKRPAPVAFPANIAILSLWGHVWREHMPSVCVRDGEAALVATTLDRDAHLPAASAPAEAPVTGA